MPKFGERQEVPQRPVTRSRAEKKGKSLEPPEMVDNSSESEDENYGYYSHDWSRQWTPLIPDLPRVGMQRLTGFTISRALICWG